MSDTKDSQVEDAEEEAEADKVKGTESTEAGAVDLEADADSDIKR